MDSDAPDEVPADEPPPAEREIVYRHRWPTRLWHWLNAVTVFVLLMSGLMIFNAHPRLYWGQYGANADPAWLQIGSDGQGGFLKLGSARVGTTGVLGRWTDGDGQVQNRAFPGWATIPSSYNLAAARRWHLCFAWILGLGLLAFLIRALWNRLAQRDLRPRLSELAPRHLWQEIKDHARLR